VCVWYGRQQLVSVQIWVINCTWSR
jgi:hypothetical protein